MPARVALLDVIPVTEPITAVGGIDTVKYAATDGALNPKEFDADTFQMYVWPFARLGHTMEFVGTLCASTTARVEALTTATEYCVAPGEAAQVSVGARALTGVPGGDIPPGIRPVGTAANVLIVKYKSLDQALHPAPLYARMFQRYPTPFSSAPPGTIKEFAVPGIEGLS